MAPLPADLLDALPDGVVVADGEGRVSRVNTVAARMLGVSEADVLGDPLADVLRLQDQEGNGWAACVRPYEGLHIRTGVPEQSWTLPDGTEVLVAARFHRAGSRVGQVVVSMRSGRGRARLDRERSDLVATVAHELRSPLTGVKGFVQALLNRWDKLNDEQKKLMLRTVHADSDRLTRLIAELLDVARIDTGRLSIYPRPCDAEALVRRVVAPTAEATARAIVVTVEPGIPEIQADPDKFTQVIANLVENALRHGDGTISIALSEIPGWADFPGVQVIVDDEGSGIPEEIRQRVFTKFWKHGERGGSGLGMYIVNGLVRAHGGILDIEDAPGGGARIVIAWPAPDVDA